MEQSQHNLTEADQKLLRRPFAPAAIKFRIQGKPAGNGTVRVVTYVDARLVAERLTEVDPDWTASYNFFGNNRENNDPIGRADYVPVACNLTVKGVTRCDVGQSNTNTADDKHVKTAVSDGTKRAAVTFGVGAYLYTLGETRIKKDEYWTGSNNKPGGINEKGLKRLRKEYEEIISKPAFVERFGTPIDYGDSLVDSASSSHADSPVASDSVGETSEQASTVIDKEADRGNPVTTGEVDAGKPVPPKKKKAKEPEETADENPLTVEAAIVSDLAELTGRSVDAALKWFAQKEAKGQQKVALKRAVKQAIERGATQEQVDEVLEKHGQLVPA